MDRALTYELSLDMALKIGYLAFDATRTSAVDVDFPIDVVLYQADSYHIVEYRYGADELSHISQWWQETLREALRNLPHDWVSAVFSKLEQVPIKIKNVIQD